MRRQVYHVIMAGGSGTRFWPVSRNERPKQFLALAGGLPLIRQAFDRAAAMSGADHVFVAAGEAHRDLVHAALPSLGRDRLIAEPCARNTAPCVGLAALRLARLDPEAVMVVSPADHVYTRPEDLRNALEAAVEAASAGGALVTLGIRPTRAETGYGYIEIEASEEEPQDPVSPRARRAARFVEKPDVPAAERYLRSGRHLWNSGVFIWKVGSILDEIRRCAPDLWSGLARIEGALGGPEEDRAVREAFAAMTSISIDNAVLEKAAEVLVVPADPGWSDVGSWDASADLAGSTEGPDVIRIDASGCFVYGEGERRRLVALVGVEDLIVVETPDALLVCRKGASQRVRAVTEDLKSRGRDDLL